MARRSFLRDEYISWWCRQQQAKAIKFRSFPLTLPACLALSCFRNKSFLVQLSWHVVVVASGGGSGNNNNRKLASKQLQRIQICCQTELDR